MGFGVVYVDTDCALAISRTMLNIERAAPYAQGRTRSENEDARSHCPCSLARRYPSIVMCNYPLSIASNPLSSDKTELVVQIFTLGTRGSGGQTAGTDAERKSRWCKIQEFRALPEGGARREGRELCAIY